MAGGPGAIFWMWVSAFFGMGTIFSEATAAQKYRVVLEDGKVNGGPAYYIRAGIKGALGNGLAVAFSIFCIIGFGIAASLIQGNTIAVAFANSFHVQPIVIGVIVSILLLVVIAGGTKRIADFVTTVVTTLSAVVR